MTRDDLEAKIWAITGRDMTGERVDALLNLAEAYSAERQKHAPQTVLHHASGADLWPVIGVLADAMLNTPEVDEPKPLRIVRGAA